MSCTRIHALLVHFTVSYRHRSIHYVWCTFDFRVSRPLNPVPSQSNQIIYLQLYATRQLNVKCKNKKSI